MHRVQPSHRPMPLFVTCGRHGCDNVWEVATKEEQALGGFCSDLCAANPMNRFQYGGSIGGRSSGRKRRADVLEKVGTLTPEQAYHFGYRKGFDAAYQQRRRKGQAA